MTESLRLVASEETLENPEVSLRPQRLDEFVGQAQARKNLRVFIEAAKTRKEAMDHVLFYGPPGLGKNNPFPDHGSRAGRWVSLNVRPCDRTCRGFGRPSHQSPTL